MNVIPTFVLLSPFLSPFLSLFISPSRFPLYELLWFDSIFSRCKREGKGGGDGTRFLSLSLPCSHSPHSNFPSPFHSLPISKYQNYSEQVCSGPSECERRKWGRKREREERTRERERERVEKEEANNNDCVLEPSGARFNMSTSAPYHLFLPFDVLMVFPFSLSYSLTLSLSLSFPPFLFLQFRVQFWHRGTNIKTRHSFLSPFALLSLLFL